MALGKGLGSLIPPRNSATNINNEAAASAFSHARDAVQELPVTKISANPQQPRRHFSHAELEDLIASVKRFGILQPLLVSRLGNAYELIAGERRLRAARIAGLTMVPVIVRDVSELEKLELALIENIQRSDLNPIEKAEGYRKLVNEFGVNHEEAAKKIGIARSNFSNTLRLLDLPGEAQKAVADAVISEGHAKILLGLPTTGQQLRYLKMIVDNHLSVRQLEQSVHGLTKQSHNKRSDTKRSLAAQPAVHVQALADDLTKALATKVVITPKGDHGTITIHYFSPEELSGIVRRISKR